MGLRFCSQWFRWQCAFTVGVLVLLAAPTSALAEDVKGRWYFGGNLSYLSTTDSVRSNAALFLGPFGDDGLPGTADPNEALSCDDTGAFCDPRPDNLLGREIEIEETFKYDFTVGYGLTSWLSLQLDASYYRADVGPVDFYVSDVAEPNFTIVDESQAVHAGELTEVPITLSAIVRFRRDSTLNPYVGIGAGVIMSELSRSSDVSQLNDRIQQFRIQDITNEFNEPLTDFAGPTATEGRIPTDLYLLSPEVDDAFEWHLAAGAEYFVNDRVSMIFDARYMFADRDVHLLISDEDQVNFSIFNESLFRPDGSLRWYNGGMSGGVPAAPSPFCVDSPNAPLVFGGGEFGCRQPPGCNQPGDAACVTSPTQLPPNQRVFCNTGAVGDFNGDGARPGDPDQCYNGSPVSSDVVVQGGSIDLTGFSVAIGVRFSF